MPQCYCASATLLRKKMWTYGLRFIKSNNANTFLIVIKSVLHQQLTSDATEQSAPWGPTATQRALPIVLWRVFHVWVLAVCCMQSQSHCCPYEEGRCDMLPPFVSLQSAAKLFPVPCSAAGCRATGCSAILVLLLSQVECFLNPADLSHVSIW